MPPKIQSSTADQRPYKFLHRCGTAAIPMRATRRVATRQMPQAYPPKYAILAWELVSQSTQQSGRPFWSYAHHIDGRAAEFL